MQASITEAQAELIEDLDDVAEHVAWEFDADNYEGISTCGFAHIGGLNGNKSFVRRVISAAKNDAIGHIKMSQRNDALIEIGGLELSLQNGSRGGCRLSIINVGDFRPGPEYQRMDVRERLHRLVLERLQYHGYADEARVRSRMD